MRTMFATALAAAASIGAASEAKAGSVVFTGTLTNIDAPSDGVGRCGGPTPPRRTVRIGNGPMSSATGTSNFGEFLFTKSHCVTLPLPSAVELGEFLYEFASGDTLFGTYSGMLTLSGTPGVFNSTLNYVVTGGAGEFAGATGAFTGIGTVNFTAGPPRAQASLSGLIDAPAIPEPGTWAMLILGFGLAGSALRRRATKRLVMQRR